VTKFSTETPASNSTVRYLSFLFPYKGSRIPGECTFESARLPDDLLTVGIHSSTALFPDGTSQSSWIEALAGHWQCSRKPIGMSGLLGRPDYSQCATLHVSALMQHLAQSLMPHFEVRQLVSMQEGSGWRPSSGDYGSSEDFGTPQVVMFNMRAWAPPTGSARHASISSSVSRTDTPSCWQ
jgi:hypothetical protein